MELNHHQSTWEFWNTKESWSPEGHAGVHQQEYSYGGEWSRAEEHQSFKAYTEPYPTSIQTPTWPMEYPNYQPYSEYQSYESYLPTYQPDYSDHHPSYTKFYPDQTCPDQPHHQPQPQQSSELTSDENYNAKSAAGETEEVTAFQQNVQSCTKSEVEMIMEMHHTYEEQQSHMDSMIRQVALLAEMIKEVKENRAKSEVNGSERMEEGVRGAEEEKPADAERESEALSEEKIPEEACDESHRDAEAIECGEKIKNTTLYLQSGIVHAPEEKVEEFTYMVKGESAQVEEPPPVIDQSEGCGYRAEEPEWKVERTKRKAARAIYWVQLPPWPEQERMGKPPHSGVRPKENKKVLGTYRHHRKKQGIKLKAVPQKTGGYGRKELSQYSSNLLFSEGSADT